jgi:hypothetical protein
MLAGSVWIKKIISIIKMKKNPLQALLVKIPNPDVLFLCHGRLHSRDNYWMQQFDEKVLDNATYIDVDKEYLPDIATDICKISPDKLREKFDVIVDMNCSVDIYLKGNSPQISNKFWGNITAWLKLGGLFVSGTVSSFILRTIVSPDMNQLWNVIESAKPTRFGMELVLLHTSNNELDRKEYMRLKEVLLRYKKDKLIDAVEQLGKDPDEIARRKNQRQDPNTFSFVIDAIKRVTNNKLKPLAENNMDDFFWVKQK